MSIDWKMFICLVVTISLSTGIVLRAFYLEYIARVGASKKSNELSDTIIPPEISQLISRINLPITVRVADNPEEIPNAATFHRYPSYVIISRLVLGKVNSVDVSQFELKYLLALVAHELGHIKLASQSMWVQEMCAIGVFGAFSFQLVSLFSFKWTYLYSWLASVFFIAVFIITSWLDEYGADAFAIKKAKISIDDLAGGLIALKSHYDKKQNARNGYSMLMRKLLANITHPPVHCRIQRIRRLYGE